MIDCRPAEEKVKKEKKVQKAPKAMKQKMDDDEEGWTEVASGPRPQVCQLSDLRETPPSDDFCLHSFNDVDLFFESWSGFTKTNCLCKQNSVTFFLTTVCRSYAWFGPPVFRQLIFANGHWTGDWRAKKRMTHFFTIDGLVITNIQVVYKCRNLIVMLCDCFQQYNT